MATAPSLVDIITCDICTEIFTDPKILPCNHSYCDGCIKKIFGHKSTIACPACRKTTRKGDIKTDFKTSSLLDTTEARSFVMTDKDYVKLCFFCKKKPVSKKCKQCVCMVCEECGENHKFIPSCSNHDIQTLTDTVNKECKNLTAIKRELTKHNQEVQHKFLLLNIHKQSMDKLYSNLLGEIEEWHAQMQADIKKHYDAMVISVKKVQAEEKTEVDEVMKVMASVKGPVEKYMQNTNCALATQNEASFLGIVDKMHLDVSMNTIKDRLQNIKMPQHPLVSMKKGQKWDCQSGLNITITRKRTPITALVSWFLPKSYLCPLDLHLRQLQKTPYCIKLSETPLQMGLHQENLWCLLPDKIDIYNTFGTWINNIQFDKYSSSVNGMVMMGNNLVISTLKSGLLHFRGSANFVLRHEIGDFVKEIQSGSFCDVTSDGNNIFTLDYTQKPSIKKYHLDVWKNWNLLENAELPYTTPSGLDTLMWNQTYVLVSSCAETQDGCVLVYHSSCILLHRIMHTKCVPRFLVPGVDGDILCSDIMNRDSNLFLLRGHGKDRFKLNVYLGESKKRNMCAVFDKAKRLWLYDGCNEIGCHTLV